jgi:hypothetical protein
MKTVRALLVAAILVASGFAVAQREPVQAENGDEVYTCADLNNPDYDSNYSSKGLGGTWEFLAGDTIKIVAAYPTDAVSLPQGSRGPADNGYYVEFWLDSSLAKSTSFPGKITYMFASDTNVPPGEPSVGWRVTGGTNGGIIQRVPSVNGIPLYADWDVSCTSAEQAAAQVVPGCDLGMQLTPDAAVGAFVWTTDVYWAPSLDATTGITMPAGKTAWVLGMDATGEFYKFVWSCNYLWAPVGTMGPNYDEVWNGTLLPTTVVE